MGAPGPGHPYAVATLRMFIIWTVLMLAIIICGVRAAERATLTLMGRDPIPATFAVVVPEPGRLDLYLCDHRITIGLRLAATGGRGRQGP
jgi:hypothetical protein